MLQQFEHNVNIFVEACQTIADLVDAKKELEKLTEVNSFEIEYLDSRIWVSDASFAKRLGKETIKHEMQEVIKFLNGKPNTWE